MRLEEVDNIGETFEILAILADENAHASLVQYLASGSRSGVYNEVSLPAGASIMERFSVYRS